MIVLKHYLVLYFICTVASLLNVFILSLKLDVDGTWLWSGIVTVCLMQNIMIALAFIPLTRTR